MRTSNHLIGVLNFLTFLLSVPILGGGIWLSSRANNTDCLKFLQWPLIIIGVSIMVVSLAGFAGACYRNTFLMRLYLVVMFVVIAVLIGFIIFAYVVTDKGSGRRVMNRAYSEYYLEDYSGWLEERVASDSYWGKIGSCIRDSHVCARMGRTINGVPETAEMFYLRHLTPIQVYTLIITFLSFSFSFLSLFTAFSFFSISVSSIFWTNFLYYLFHVFSTEKKTLEEEIVICLGLFLFFEFWNTKDRGAPHRLLIDLERLLLEQELQLFTFWLVVGSTNFSVIDH